MKFPLISPVAPVAPTSAAKNSLRYANAGKLSGAKPRQTNPVLPPAFVIESGTTPPPLSRGYFPLKTK